MRRAGRSALAAALALPFVAAAAAVAAVDPDLRGPLAAVAELWLAGHEDEAAGDFARAAAELAEGGLDPSALAPPRRRDLAAPRLAALLPRDEFALVRPAAALADAAPAVRAAHARLELYLGRRVRDDAARALFRALEFRWHGLARDAAAAAARLRVLAPRSAGARLLARVLARELSERE